MIRPTILLAALALQAVKHTVIQQLLHLVPGRPVPLHQLLHVQAVVPRPGRVRAEPCVRPGPDHAAYLAKTIAASILPGNGSTYEIGGKAYVATLESTQVRYTASSAHPCNSL